MLAFLSANIGSIVVGLLILLVIAGVVIHMIRNKKKGKSGCGCGCDGCRYADGCAAPACHSTKEKDK